MWPETGCAGKQQNVGRGRLSLTKCKVRPVFPTVADVLALPALRAGTPTVRAGRSALLNRVRWVHVSEQRQPAGTLSGGELILSIGAAVADPATDHLEYLTALRDAGAVGLVIELGQHLRSLPETLVQAARALRFPLVELRAAVRFVEVTEVVHAWILNEQYAHMQFSQRVTETFRTLMVDSAGVSTVVGEAAALLELPVVLEDLGHRALAFAGDVAEDLLRDWTVRSRQALPAGPAEPSGPEGWFSAAVGPRVERWGRLVVPRRAADAERVRLVLTQAAEAIAVLVRIDASSPGIELEAQGGLLADILGASEASESALRVRARALGLPTGGPFAVLVVVAPAAAGEGDREALEVVASAVRHTRRPALVGPLRPGRIAVVVSCASLDDEPDVVCALAPGLPADRVRAVAASDPAAAFADLPDALHHALQTADVADASPDPAARAVWRPRHLGVRGLVWRLRDDRRLLSYVEEQLGPLLRLPEARRNELLKTLRAYVETDGVVTAFASRIGTSRPAAYARLRRLSELLDRDLDDPPTRLSVYLALLVLDQGSTGRDAALAPGR
ncbi:purine catabolism regulator [Saccharopolyspora erythraea NRRL 2338]|nr:purine catabolism regulator [Saccharopolyspora erythraea NRRL 2338]